MIKSEATKVNHHPDLWRRLVRSASEVLRDGRAKEEMSLVSSFSPFSVCATESVGRDRRNAADADAQGVEAESV